MSKNSQILHLFIKYLAHEATDQEKQNVEQWLKRDVANQQLLHSLEPLLHKSQFDSTEWDEDEQWNQIAVKTGLALSQAEPLVDMTRQSRWNSIQWLILSPVQWCFGTDRSSFQYAIRFALVILVIFGCTMGTIIYFKQLQQKRELAYQSTYQEFYTQKGERATLLLSDGTSIHLNSATKVRFPVIFGKEKREVFLDGEGYFKVAHNPRSPFFVHTADANIRVLGTTFDVMSYAEDNKTQVIVAEGQVAFAGINQQDTVLVTRNQMSWIARGGSPTTAEVIRTEEYLAWLNNQMVFDHAPLTEVIKQLSRKYDVTFKVHDARLLNRHIVATYGNESFIQILQSLSYTLRLRYEMSGKVVLLYNR